MPNAADGCDIGAYEDQLVNLVKSVGRDAALRDETLTYTLTLRNTLTESLRIDDVTDTLWPTPLSFADADGNPFALPGDLAAGASVTATFTHTVADADFTDPAYIDGRLVNTATVMATFDPGGLNLPLSDQDDASTRSLPWQYIFLPAFRRE